MTACLYPVALEASCALDTPAGYAQLKSQADLVLGEPSRFCSEDVGPPFSSLLDAQTYWSPLLKGNGADCVWIRFRETVDPASAQHSSVGPIEPTFKDGRRWPASWPRIETVWRLNVSYWGRYRNPSDVTTEEAASNVEEGALQKLIDKPLMPRRAQKGLDIGLFECPLPEAPGRYVADE